MCVFQVPIRKSKSCWPAGPVAALCESLCGEAARASGGCKLTANTRIAAVYHAHGHLNRVVIFRFSLRRPRANVLLQA